MNCSRISALERFAAALAEGARLELYLTPKPGLVDRADNGSHPDLSLVIMERSLVIVADYLAAIVASLARGEAFPCQQRIAIDAEARMLASLGTNTHKGYIFLAGMLVIARRHAGGGDEAALRAALASLATAFFADPAQAASASHGERARRQYQAGGIVAEAMGGYPALFDVALPAFRAALRRHGSVEAASFVMLGRLMQTVEDTTTLHRAGSAGLARVRRDGEALEALVDAGGDWRRWLADLNRAYVATRLTIGGVADMLGLAYGCLIAGGELSGDDPLFAPDTNSYNFAR